MEQKNARINTGGERSGNQGIASVNKGNRISTQIMVTIPMGRTLKG